MSSTMLQLIQQAAGEMGLNIPVSVAGNQTQDVVQMHALLNAVGYEAQRKFIWEALAVQYITTVSFTTLTGSTTEDSTTMALSSTASIDNTYGIQGSGINQACYISAVVNGTTVTLSQPATGTYVNQQYTLTKVKYAMPSNYDRQIDNTHWDKTKHWQMLGPETAQQWEWLISGYISTGPRIRYRIFGSYFQIWPFVASAETIGFEYISNAWARAADGTPKTSMTLDTDTCIFPDRVMVLGLKAKYFEAKGFAPVFNPQYEAELSIAYANDQGSQTLSFAPRVGGILITSANIPDSGCGPN